MVIDVALVCLRCALVWLIGGYLGLVRYTLRYVCLYTVGFWFVVFFLELRSVDILW